MPLTCSHPAAILPFRRFITLNFSALIIGSMTPDTGYFIGQRHLAKLAHLPLGTVFIDIPTGLILLGFFYLLRRELCHILPAPHRNQLTPLAQRKPAFTIAALLVVVVSILLGTWTHIVWDQFTHDGTYAFRHFPPLRIALANIGSQKITIAYSLQYISTLAGAAILAFYYIKWLRIQPPKPDNQSDKWRYALWFGLGVVSLAIGTMLAIHLSPPVHDFQVFREFAYKQGVTAVSVFTILMIIAAVLCYPRSQTTDG